jgi:hypothetical protein
VYVYGVVTYITYKNTCSNLKNTGFPGQVCVSPDSKTARCWNSGSQMSCSHCVFGYKSAQTGHVCKFKDDIIEDNITACKYINVRVYEVEKYLVANTGTEVKIEYNTDNGYETPILDGNNKNTDAILKYLKGKCYYDLKITSARDPQIAVKTECQNVTTNGDGICRKDYDTYVKEQHIRYRPDGESKPSLKFTNEVTPPPTT